MGGKLSSEGYEEEDAATGSSRFTTVPMLDFSSLDFDVVGDLHDDRRILDVGDHPVDSAAGDDLVARLDCLDHRIQLLLPLALRADSQEIENREMQTMYTIGVGLKPPGWRRSGRRASAKIDKKWMVHG